jgi:hypothetical protein
MYGNPHYDHLPPEAAALHEEPTVRTADAMNLREGTQSPWNEPLPSRPPAAPEQLRTIRA